MREGKDILLLLVLRIYSYSFHNRREVETALPESRSGQATIWGNCPGRRCHKEGPRPIRTRGPGIEKWATAGAVAAAWLDIALTNDTKAP